jgi:hypothetical protein
MTFVFYTKNLKDVSMKWGVINLNTNLITEVA